MATSIKSILLNALLPQFCLRCKKEGFALCLDCLCTIDVVKNPSGFSLPQAPLVDKFFSTCSFEEKLVQTIIKKFKYQPFLKSLSLPLSYLIISHFSLSENNMPYSKTGDKIIVIPVPLAKKKQKERGFNQSELIAKELALFYSLPLSTNNLIKIKQTLSQTQLNKEQRKNNVAAAFLIKKPKMFSGKTVFLIDDVVTTGATMNECAKILKQAKAKKVYGITVAFEPLK